MNTPISADVPLVTLLKDLHESQVHRRAEQKKLDLMEEREKTITLEILKREKASFTSGNYVVDIKTVKEPFAANWAETMEYIKRTGAVDLLEKRLLKSGVKARWEDGETIPGVTSVDKTTMKVEVL